MCLRKIQYALVWYTVLEIRMPDKETCFHKGMDFELTLLYENQSKPSLWEGLMIPRSLNHMYPNVDLLSL